jgi:hypothetical protein
MGNRRHQEWFGPDLLRAPALSGSPPVAGVQIASAIAQLRAPLARDDTAIEDHADFIRSLADKLFPDYAVDIRFEVGGESSDQVDTTIRVDSSQYSLLHCWLSDSAGGGLTATAPDSVSFAGGAVLETITAKKHFLIVAPKTGVVTASVSYTGTQNWYWGVSRFARAYFSTQLSFA